MFSNNPTTKKATSNGVKSQDLNTKEENTWCPGCPNFGILQAVKGAVADLANTAKIKVKDTAIVTGIGCHAKIYDYLNLNSFYGIHGRVLPICLGMKLGNPGLRVIGFGGDGDTYSEGISHFIHLCRYNPDLTMIVHNNQVFSLTTGQATPTSEKGFIGGFSPSEVVAEKPINPIALALEAGAGFVARGYALDVPHLKDLMKQAIAYKGFAFIDILQPCTVYHNVIPYFQKNVYKLEQNHNITDLQKALTKAREWEYGFNKDKRVPIGVFYKKERPAFEKQWPQLKTAWHKIERKINWKKTIQEFK